MENEEICNGDYENPGCDCRLNAGIIDVYTIYDAEENSENTYVLYLDNFVVEEERINNDGEQVDNMKVAKSIVRIKSFNPNGTTNVVTDYTFLGNGTDISDDPLPPVNKIYDDNNYPYPFFFHGWLSDATRIALNSTGSDLFVLKSNQGYVMWFKADGNGNFVFDSSIDIREATKADGKTSLGYKVKNSSDIEYYEDDGVKYLLILGDVLIEEEEKPRVIRVKIIKIYLLILFLIIIRSLSQR